MALTACKECGNEISTKAKACPKCGAKVPRFKWWLWIPLGLIFFFFLIGLTANSRGGGASSEVDRARQVISLCWADYESKSLDPPTKRFAAAACERLENEFRQKYGRNP